MHTTMLPIFDGHNDALTRVCLPASAGGRDFFARGESGHIDLPRAREGGLAGGLFAICAPPDKAERAFEFTTEIARRFFELLDGAGGALRVVRTVRAIEESMDAGTLAVALHLEGAEAIDPGLESLPRFFDQGFRSIGITWSRPNAFASGVPFAFPGGPDTGPGLTPAGTSLVRACNRLGVLIDLSHLNERGFWDVAAISTAPLVATHSAAHALCPSSRNVTDRQLDAIGASGGVVGIPFCTAFLREDGRTDVTTPISAIVRHVAYVAQRIGIDHVAFGSDFDGATVPRDLGDAAGLPRLVDALRGAGFDEESIHKVARLNWLRVLRATWGA